MKINKYTKVSINIVLIFTTIMLASIIPDMFPQIFGDWLCKGCTYREADYAHYHLPTWHCGYRHWIWCAMGLSLFVVQVVRMIYIVDKDE